MDLKPITKKKPNYNLYRKYWDEVQDAKYLTNFPLHLDIELTSMCNLRCKMCWQSQDPDQIQMGMMKEDLFKKIIDEGVDNGLCAIKLQSRGEAMMHPKIFKLSQYAKKKGVLDIHLTTNGTLFLKKGKIEELFNSGIDKLIFSIDDAHIESINEIYKNKNKKPDIVKYFNEISELKRKKNLKKPYLVVQTFCDDNANQKNEISKINKIFNNVDYINMNNLWNSKPFEESLPGLKKNYDFHPCSYLWSRMLIFWNGEVVPCCRDYQGKILKMGNANKQTVKEIWLSENFMKMRKTHLDGERSKIKICDNCDISTSKKT